MSTHPPIVDRINRLRAADRRAAAGRAPSGRSWRAWSRGSGRRTGDRLADRRWPTREGPWYPAIRRRAANAVGHRAEIAQSVEHATENRGVASSILALGTTSRRWSSIRAEVAQLVEHHLAKVRVAGSSPVFRSIILPEGPAAPSSSGRTADFGSVNRGSNPRGAASTRPRRGARPSGDVVKWFNTEVCKTSIHRFESGRRLHSTRSRSAGHLISGPFEFPAAQSGGDAAGSRILRKSGGRDVLVEPEDVVRVVAALDLGQPSHVCPGRRRARAPRPRRRRS